MASKNIDCKTKEALIKDTYYEILISVEDEASLDLIANKLGDEFLAIEFLSKDMISLK